jgi:hypothetical protein
MSRVSLLGAGAIFLLDGVIRWAWNDGAADGASPNHATLIIIAGAVCGMACLTFVACRMSHERAVRKRVIRVMSIRGQ